ncbi:MAG TPA: DUF5666 domain-containing protein [Gammaproteobacteria bacterium]|nr:DUF5666 domain-containing protein [Gammaproteobacteria bacterium]
MNGIFQIIMTLAVAALVLGGCSSDPATAGIDRGGVTTPVVAQGPISGFGSIVVNGVHYGIDDAQIQVNGGPATAADLAIGQLVTVVGDRAQDGTTGNAASVAFNANVTGPVQSLDAAAATLVVLGQSVVTSTATVFDLGNKPAEIASLQIGERVQISGFVGADGIIDATRIEARSPQSGLRLLGKVANLDRAAARFNINALVVSYGAARLIDGFPGGEPTDADEVVVEGTVLGSNGELLAEELELNAPGFEREEGEEAEIEGLITRYVSALDFDVAGLATTTSAATEYEGGSAASLARNVKVKVEGRINVVGIIEARKIQVKDGGRVVGEDD